MSLSAFTEPSTPAELAARLVEIRELDARLESLQSEIKSIERRRESVERLVIEDMTSGKIDKLTVAGRSWRVEWTHSMSVTGDNKAAVIDALRDMGFSDQAIGDMQTINTARLKAILKEHAESRGIDVREPWAAGTPLEGKAGEFVAPRLRFTTTG